MSYLEKSKRQAKRLLQLAKKNNESIIPVKTLSEAQNVVAIIDGYNNWHNYSENLKNKDLQNNSSKLINNLEASVKYLSQNHIENFEKYYLNSPTKEIKIFSNPPLKLSYNIKNNGMHIPIGIMKEKKAWAEKKHTITLSSQHCTIWGGEGGLKYLNKDMIEKAIMKNIGSIYVDTTGDNKTYSDLYKICHKYDYVKNLYCINFMSENKNKSSHSFDPINPLIPFKESFLNIFNIEKNLFSELFYALCKECYNDNIAIDSTVIYHLLSLNTLIENQNEILKNILNKYSNQIHFYLSQIGINNNLKENWLKNNKEAIQNHHQQVQDILNTNHIIKDYEERGVFSIYPQIDLQNIVAQNKVLAILFPQLTTSNPHVKKLTNILMTNLLTIEIDIINSIKSSVIPTTNELVGFFTIQIFEGIEKIINEQTLKLFNELLSESYHSRKMLSFISAKDYKTLEDKFPTMNYKYLLSVFMSHFKQHIIMRQTTPITEFCYEVKNQIISNCKNIDDNIFNQDNRGLIELKMNEFYFYKKGFSKEIQEGLLYKLEFNPLYTYHKEMPVLWIEHEAIRK